VLCAILKIGKSETFNNTKICDDLIVDIILLWRLGGNEIQRPELERDLK
jgi:hypothetical protein